MSPRPAVRSGHTVRTGHTVRPGHTVTAGRMPARTRRVLPALALLALAAAVSACGGGGGSGGFFGDVFVENDSVSAVTSFRVAPSGSGAYTGNLLSDVVLSGERRFAGSFVEDTYDAQAFQQDGTFTPWFGVFVQGGTSTDFVVF